MKIKLFYETLALFRSFDESLGSAAVSLIEVLSARVQRRKFVGGPLSLQCCGFSMQRLLCTTVFVVQFTE